MANAFDQASPPPVDGAEQAFAAMGVSAPKTPEEAFAAMGELDNGSCLVKRDEFTLGLRRLLNLSIEGFPLAIRSTRAVRNEYLRKSAGDQEAAIEQAIADSVVDPSKISEQEQPKFSQDSAAEDAANMLKKQQGTAALLGLVPYVGLSSQIVLCAWYGMRLSCLQAAINGQDLLSEETRAKILYANACMRVTAADVLTISKATGLMWAAIAGPGVESLAVSMVVSAFASAEAYKVANKNIFQSFMAGRIKVPPEEYKQVLDVEPTPDDIQALLKDPQKLYAMVQDRAQKNMEWDNVTEKEQKKASAWVAKVTGEGKAEDVKKFFESIDANGDGTIDKKEFMAVFKKKGLSEKECKKLLSEVDTDGDGSISYAEFTAWVMQGSVNRIAEKNGIYLKESPIALGANAADAGNMVKDAGAAAVDAASNLAATASGYFGAVSEYSPGVDLAGSMPNMPTIGW